MNQVLVLNQDYQAISLVDFQRAFILVLLKKADTVETYTDQKIRTVKAEFDFPSVIRLTSYVNLPYKKINLTRHNIFRRDGNRCVYCGSRERLTLDHVIPRAKGGRTTWNNLVTACYKCNSKKGDLDLQDSGLELKTQPYRPSFIMFLSQFSGKIDQSWKPYLLMS
ncbi:MAG: HNH endonuclease [Bacteroidota bacterium]